MSAIDILAPLAGTLAAMEDVPDPVFAQGLVGPGVAIVPAEEGDVDVLAPLAGKIAKIHPHAFVIMAGSVNVLVHLGLDTVKLEGEGFTVHAATGDRVEAGQRLITWNPGEIRSRGLDPICPVVFMETTATIDYAKQPGEATHASDVIAHAS
ncbi:MAG: PTS glucose transporter subunit IIA [Actinomycetaceae bacterium]|nr:PTS glucose transporter subunit IIA [Actinomycetaceae bacterium]